MTRETEQKILINLATIALQLRRIADALEERNKLDQDQVVEVKR